MKRREFLVGAAVGAATVCGLAGQATQAPATGARQGGPGAPAAGGQAQGGRGGGRGRGPAAVPPAKLARISLMTLNFNPYIREPGNATPGPDQTLDRIRPAEDVRRIVRRPQHRYQHSTIVQSEKDPDFIKELKARLDESSVKMTQINLEFGTVQSISHKDPEGRRQAVEHVKQWIDIAAQYGCPARDDQPAADAADQRDACWRRRGDESDGRLRTAEEREGVRGNARRRHAEYVQQIGGVKPWEFMIGVIKDAGAASNVDIGNVGAMNQQELHDCIKGWFPYSSGNMHIKSSPFWDVGQAVKFTESLGYQGLYSIEVTRHEAVRIVYNTILANLP